MHEAPQNDRLNLSFVKDNCVVAKKMTANGQKWSFLKPIFSIFFLPILEDTVVKNIF